MSVPARLPVNGCDTFETINLPAGFRRHLISVPIDTFLVTWNDLALALALPSTGVQRGTITGITCETGVFIQCAAGTAACSQVTLVPGEAYVVDPLSTGGLTYTNPAACSPIAAPAAAACPLDSLDFVDATTMNWAAPVGCRLPLLYDVIRGELPCLRGFCTNDVAPLTPPCPTCTTILDNGVDATASDRDIPPAGTAYWYLVRVDGGTLNGLSTAAQCTDLDLMLAGACL